MRAIFFVIGLVLMLVIAGCVSETDAEKTAKKKAKETPKEEKGKTPSPAPAPQPSPKPSPAPQAQPSPQPQPTPQPAPQAAPALPQRSGTYVLRTLIADIGDRTLLDRGLAAAKEYDFVTPETDPNAHPFSDGRINSALSGVSNTFLFKIDGSLFSPFADITLTDPQTNTQYTEKQFIFVNAQALYRDSMDAVGGRFRDFVYQIKFDPAIPTNVRDMRIKYTNFDRVLNSLEPPRDVQIQNAGQVVSGGTIVTSGGRIRDGDTLEGGWKVRLTWKGQVGANPDQLRSIILYKDISDFFASAQGYNIGGSNSFTFKFSGLDKNPSSSDDYDTLRCEYVDTIGGFTYVADGPTSNTRESSASYVSCRTDVSSGFSTAAGSGSEFRVLLLTDANAALTSNLTIGASSGFAGHGTLMPGDIILKLEGSPGRWVYVGSIDNSQIIRYPTAGASTSLGQGGVLRIGWGIKSYWQDVNGMSLLTNTPAANPTTIGNAGGLVILLSEDAGEGQSANKPDAIAAYFDIVQKSFNKDSPNYRYLKDKCFVASVSAFGGTPEAHDLEGRLQSQEEMFNESNYITHRGTVCKELSDSVFTWKVPKQVVHAQFTLSTE